MDEKKVLLALKKQYQRAAEDIQGKIHIHNNKIDILLQDLDAADEAQRSILQAQIYQKQFQENLKAQIDDIVKKLNTGQVTTIEEYLNDCYTTGFVGSAYDRFGQGIPIVSPIDRKAMLKAVTLDPKLSKKMYGSYMNQMSDNIRAEISRGIATADSYEHIARNLSNRTNQSFNKTMRIVRTEGHRIQIESAVDNMKKAIEAGADIVKQWNAVLDQRTRNSHRHVHNQLRDFNEKFSNGLMWPGDNAGSAAEVINCRCSLGQRPKWALDEEELEVQKQHAAYWGLDKTETFREFEKKFLKAAEEMAEITVEATLLKMTLQEAFETKTQPKTAEITDTDIKAVYDYMSASSYIVNDKLRNGMELTPDDISFIINLDAALDKMPKYSGNLQRSLIFNNEEAVEAFMSTHQAGQIVTYDEYLSTTKGQTYNPDGQVQIYIADAENGRDISEYNKSEQEVLYKRKSSFYIQKVVKQDGKYYILMVENNE